LLLALPHAVSHFDRNSFFPSQKNIVDHHPTPIPHPIPFGCTFITSLPQKVQQFLQLPALDPPLLRGPDPARGEGASRWDPWGQNGGGGLGIGQWALSYEDTLW